MPSVAESYHQDTKYTPEGIRRGGRGLDFDHQPVPFKDYHSAEAYDLSRWLPEGHANLTDAELAAWRDALDPADRAVAEVSHLLYLTNGITGMIPYSGQPFLMRAAPSAGGLYPTELYLAVRRHPALPDGLYNYQVRDHSLVRFWTQDPWPGLLEATFAHPALADAELAVIATGVFFRSEWRYEDRAYRRILLDTGHVLGNLAIAAPLVGRHAMPIGGFADARLGDLLFLDATEEAPLAIVALRAAELPDLGATALAGTRHEVAGVPEGQRMRALHRAGAIDMDPGAAPDEMEEGDKYTFAFGEKLEAPPLAWGGHLAPTIIHRRSTRGYTGAPITRAELAALMDFTYQPALSSEPGVERHPRTFAPELLETFLAIHDVEGLDPGCYHYAAARRELRQIRFTGLRQEVQYLALGQELAGQASVVVFHTADLPRAVARYGDRAYRYLHLDAGHLGERLNLAAVRLGIGVSGIGGFFDDQVNDLLGIPEREAVVYLTTLGRPLPG